jgi:transcriptional regulator with XRE-family HTH domain
MAKKIANPVDQHVGARIRMQRMVRGFSQTELGKAVGVTFQQVQKYEKGTNRVSASRLQRVANVLEVTPDFFFEGAPAKVVGNSGSKEVTIIDEFISSRDGVALSRQRYSCSLPSRAREALRFPGALRRSNLLEPPGRRCGCWRRRHLRFSEIVVGRFWFGATMELRRSIGVCTCGTERSAENGSRSPNLTPLARARAVALPFT